MRVNNISNIVFGYKHPLKTAYKKGLLPDVKVDIYGKPLSKKNVSLEHITPASQGGKTVFSNLALADKIENSRRGVKPIEDVTTKKNWFIYLSQFLNVKNKYIDGFVYICEILKRLRFDLNEFLKFARYKHT